MNPAAVLLEELHHRGIQIQAAGDRLRYRPATAMTEDLAGRVAAHKQELLALLTTGNSDKMSDDTWVHSIHRLLASCPDIDMRIALEDVFEETAATLEFQQGLATTDAEMQAFGLVLFRILQIGLDARTA